jgi:hypothetical protein
MFPLTNLATPGPCQAKVAEWRYGVKTSFAAE